MSRKRISPPKGNEFAGDLDKYLLLTDEDLWPIHEWYGWSDGGVSKRYGYAAIGCPPIGSMAYSVLSKRKKTEARKSGVPLPYYPADYWAMRDVEREFEKRGLLPNYLRHFKAVCRENSVKEPVLLSLYFKTEAALRTVEEDNRRKEREDN